MAKEAGRRFMNERLRSANRRMEGLEEENKCMEIRLQRALSKEDYDRILKTSDEAAERELERIKVKQRTEFEKGQTEWSRRDTLQSVDKRKWVVNLSKRQLSSDQRKMLELGMKFAPTPRQVPKMEYVIQVEDELHSQVVEKEGEAVLAALASVLKKTKVPKGNARRAEWEALVGLKNDASIAMLEADKGNATVVMDTDENERGALAFIGKAPFQK